jgi:hypothetical protein
VSAVAPTCEEAEVAATAAFVPGPRGAAPFLSARGLVVPLAGAPENVAPWPRRQAA